jgi:hypothetical protein
MDVKQQWLLESGAMGENDIGWMEVMSDDEMMDVVKVGVLFD